VVNEDFGASELAERFGVKRYPAVFVNDVLVAKPKDFGFFGEGGSQGSGRYTPWLNAESQARFKADLQDILERAVRGDFAATGTDSTPDEDRLARLPDFEVEDIHHTPVRASDLRDTVTIVEFWATWCPPCLRALPWLVELQERHAGELRIVGIAVESHPEDVRRIAEENELPFPVILNTPELARSFGDLTSVPTLFVFGVGGELVRVVYGSPPGEAEEIEALLEQLISPANAR